MITITYKTSIEVLDSIHVDDEICDIYLVCGRVVEIEKVTKRNSVFFNYLLNTGQSISVIR